MNQPPHDRGSVLVIALAVITALGVVAAVMLEGTQTFLRRERGAWSAVVALADVQSAEVWWLAELRRQAPVTCTELLARSPPPLHNGSEVTLHCDDDAPPLWAVTVSATHGGRAAVVALVVSTAADGSLTVHTRSLLTGPKPALTNAA